VERIEQLSGRQYADNPRAFRVVADHVRASAMAVADGVYPSNVEAGYVVRRMLRRAVLYGRDLGITQSFCGELSRTAVDLFKDVYPGLDGKQELVAGELAQEEEKFKRTLERGLNEYHKLAERLRRKGERVIDGEQSFNLFQTYGFPLPLTVELAQQGGLEVDQAGFEQAYQAHKDLSRRGTEAKFSGGLADRSDETTRLHTATHLLHAALRQVLGPHVQQMGSNITPERLRFDFRHSQRLDDEQLRQVETLVNQQIERDLPVSFEIMPLEQALQGGALAFFGERYGEQVKVYQIGDYSKEVCGGPHARHTGELGHFKIAKQEAVGQGVRRIRGVLESKDQ
jgi:alanyl-tRNA synthetase